MTKMCCQIHNFVAITPPPPKNIYIYIYFNSQKYEKGPRDTRGRGMSIPTIQPGY